MDGWWIVDGMVWYDVRGMRVCASSRTQSKISPGNLREGPIATKINSIRSGKEGRGGGAWGCTVTKAAKRQSVLESGFHTAPRIAERRDCVARSHKQRVFLFFLFARIIQESRFELSKERCARTSVVFRFAGGGAREVRDDDDDDSGVTVVTREVVQRFYIGIRSTVVGETTARGTYAELQCLYFYFYFLCFSFPFFPFFFFLFSPPSVCTGVSTGLSIPVLS